MRRNRTTLGVALAAFATLVLAAYATAQQADPVASYTGCLRNGKLELLAVGDTALAPCATGSTPVRLGGGDITAVHARSGLMGGGENGQLEIGVDPTVVQNRVAGDCRGTGLVQLDASIGAVHGDGSVSCNSDDKSDVIAGFADGPGDLPVGATPQQIAELPLPEGKYVISALLGIRPGGSAGSFFVRCDLRAGTDFDHAELDVTGTLVPNTTHVGRMPLTVVHQFTQPGAAVLSCTTPTGGKWSFLKLTAIRVAGISNAPLALP